MQLDRLLIYVSPVTWKSFKQRSHEMVAYCRGEGYERIVWIEPYPVRLPSIWDWRRPRNRSNQLSNQGTVSEKVTITSLPIEPVPGLRAINSMLWRRNLKKLNDELAQARDSRLIIGKPSGFALALLNLGVLGGTLYDAMDNFPDFYTGLSRRYMADLEAKIVTRVDKVLTTTHCIRDRLQGLSSDIDVVPNGLATDVFSSESTSLITERHKESERVVVGYVGTIGRWFDWNLLIAFAQTCPEVEFRIVGPVFVPWYGILPRNILLMGELQHADAMNELARFDIGLIPFMQNSLTDGVDPIKYYEYIAFGKPVITTRFGEMQFRNSEDGVIFVDKYSDFKDVLKHSLEVKIERDFLTRFRQQNSWHNRFDSSYLHKFLQ